MALLIVSLLMAACGHSPAAESDDLWGRSFVSTSVRGAPSVVGDAGIELVFKEDDENFITVSAGCNEIRATADLTGERVEAELMSITEVGCSAELHERDQWLEDFFAADPQYTVDGDRLTLNSGDATIQFVEADVGPPR